MLTITATGRYSKCVSNEVITAGSVGIPAVFNLNEDFDGLSPIAVFRGSGVSFDVALIGSEVIVPHEVLANVGGILEVGVYARNGEGTIVIPTVWSVAGTIREGAIASGIDPSEPTPDWTAQVQAAASEAVQTANDAKDIAENAKEVAITSADSAQKSAVSANNSAARSSAAANAADRARDSAERYRDDTLTYSVIADESANNAHTYAQNAETSARDASNSADVATRKEAAASEAATNAARSEENAFNSAEEAADASDNAEQAAEQASLSAGRAYTSSQNAAESSRLAALSEAAASTSALTANEAKIASETAQSEAEAAKVAAETAKNRSEELYDYVAEANRSATEAAALAVAAKTDAETAAESATESAAVVQEVADRLPAIEEDLDIAKTTANDARITLFDGTPLVDYAVRDLNYTGTPGKSDSTCLAVKRRGNRIVLNGGNINNASKPNAFVKLTGNTTGRTVNSSTIRNWTDGITLKIGRMYKATVLYVSGETSAISVPATSLSVDNLGESATIGYASRDGYGRFIRYFVATQELNLILYVPCYQITYTDYTVDVILEEVDETVGEYLPSMVTNRALAVGDFRIVNGELFRVTAPVASGGTLIPGTNCVKTTLSGEIETLNDTVDGLSDDVTQLQSDVADAQSMIATVEADSIASKEYAIGDLLVFEGKLYQAVSAISLGDTLIPDGNIELTTVEQQLASSGGGAVADVQINGTSIVSDGVANIPVAVIPSGSTASNLGLVKVRNGYDGLRLNIGGIDPGRLSLNPTESSKIKAGNDGYAAVTTLRQHEAAFYGLAKAAGDTTQATSSNAVGTYTDAAKAAIQSMLNVPDKTDIDSKAPSIYKTAGPAAVVTVTDGADDMPVRQLVVDIPVTQEGSGDPSPENVRPFVGRIGATVAITDTAPNEAKAFVFEPTQEGSGTPSPTNVRPIEPGLMFERDDGTTLTVYGGTLTIDSDGTGKLVNRYYYLDGGALTWARDASSWDFVTFRASTVNYYANNARATVLSTQYPATTKNNAAAAGDNHVWMHYVSAANHWLVVRDDSKASMTAAEFKAAMSGIYFAVQRGNPVTYTLSASEVVRAIAALGINGSVISVTFPDEAGTVCGGTLTINNDGSGTLTKTHGYFDGGAKTWTKLTNYNYGTFWTTASNLKYEQKGNTVFSSNYKPTNNNAASARDDLYCWAKARSTTVNDVYVKDTANANMTAAEFKAAMSGVQFVYVLANPVTYQLTAEQIRTLAGSNNIWSDAGDVTAVYPADTKTYVDAQAAALAGEIDALGEDVDALEGDVADLSALPIISPPDVETLVEDGEYTDEAKIALQKALGIWEPPWELVNDITLTEEGRIDLTADDDGNPYNLRGVFITVYYAANTLTASAGYGRYFAVDEKGQFLASETGKYTSVTYNSTKFLMVLRQGPFALMPFSTPASTGGRMTWTSKYFDGFALNFGNITRIYMNANDVEPAGTNIKIYAQRAY